MKHIEDISSYLNNINNNFDRFIYLYEQVWNDDEIEKINRLKNSGDIKSQLKELTLNIQLLKNEFKNLDFKDIKYSIVENGDKIIIIEPDYKNGKISAIISKLQSLIEDDEYLDNILFKDGFRTFIPSIELHKNELNRIDINDGLPDVVRGIGLGKNIYFSLIYKYGYISSNKLGNTSIDADNVWHSIAKNENFYTFSYNSKLISFYSEYDYNMVLDILENFYIDYDEDFDEIGLDPTFIENNPTFKLKK